jgi:NAD(P)-dependent dehydrogenase (short-subunit alcohol dehydrogenase family)
VFCDLGVSAQIQALVQDVVAHFGHIDILVNNARAIIGRDRVPITDLREDVWHHFMAINTTAVFLCTKFVGQTMVQRGQGGRIINIASNASKQASANGAAYSASKFAVLGLTQAAALDLAPYGITVNAVGPGLIATDLTRTVTDDRATAEIYLRQIPAGRFGTPDDVAGAVAFLVSPDAAWITGHLLVVDGGQTLGTPFPV